MSHKLKTHLVSCYGSFADRRIKDVEKAKTFVVDTREQAGIASDGSLYGWFCGVLADVESDDSVRITLYGSIPKSPEVDASISVLGGSPGAARVSFAVDKESLPRLRQLAGEIEGIVAPGRRYPIAGYKYMCPRTADSLRTLANHLEQFWN